MIVVAIIGLLSGIAMPNFVKARRTSQADVCISNLRQIDSCVQQWALETGQDASAAPDSAAVAFYVRGGALPKCAVGGDYVFEPTIGATPCVKCPNEGTLPAHTMLGF